MARLNLNLDRLRTLTATQAGGVQGAVRMSSGDPCATTTEADCAPPATAPDKGSIGTKATFAGTTHGC